MLSKRGRSRSSASNRIRLWIGCLALLSAAALMQAQARPPAPQDRVRVEGTVRNSHGQPVAGAAVMFKLEGETGSVTTRADGNGAFAITTLRPGSYSVWAEGAPGKSAIAPLALSPGESRRVDLILNALPSGSPHEPASSSTDFQFEDQPKFTVAGLTDWTNAGGHGSDVRLRASETLTRETRTLSSEHSGDSPGAQPAKAGAGHESEEALREAVRGAPGSFEANRQMGVFYLRAERYAEAIPFLKEASEIQAGDYLNAYDLALAYCGAREYQQAREQAQRMLKDRNKAEVHRLLGDIAERTGDPLEAVREYEQAVQLDPSEENYFDWGIELLFHRALEPAAQVFAKGNHAHPHSARILMGLGVALYARGFYDEAARRIGEASDLNPDARDPYLFLGKMEAAARLPMQGADEKLARFLHLRPDDALANYYYALSLWKRHRISDSAGTAPRVESLLRRAVELDPRLGQGYLQLGILYAAQQKFPDAVHAFEQAVEATPDLEEAHYRLAQAYTRVGDESKARQEFQEYQRIDKQETAQIEKERRDIRQFVIVLRDQPSAPKP